jgi:hypothetical protein
VSHWKVGPREHKRCSFPRSQVFMLRICERSIKSFSNRGTSAVPSIGARGFQGGILVSERVAMLRAGAPEITAGFPAFRTMEDDRWAVPTVSVVVSAKNEARNLAHVFASIPSWVDGDRAGGRAFDR